MNEIILTSSVLILIIAALRRILRGRIAPTLQYALWLLVALRLLIPGTLFTAPVSAIGFAEDIYSAVVESLPEETPPAADTLPPLYMPQQNILPAPIPTPNSDATVSPAPAPQITPTPTRIHIDWRDLIDEFSEEGDCQYIAYDNLPIKAYVYVLSEILEAHDLDHRVSSAGGSVAICPECGYVLSEAGQP